MASIPGWPDEPDEPMRWRRDDHTEADHYSTEFQPTSAADLLGIEVHIAINPDTDEMIIHIPSAFIRVTQVVHEEGKLKLQMHRISPFAP